MPLTVDADVHVFCKLQSFRQNNVSLSLTAACY